MIRRFSPSDRWELFLSVVGIGSLLAWLLMSWAQPWGVFLVVALAIAVALGRRRRMRPLALAAALIAIVLPGVADANSLGPWAAAQVVLFSCALHMRTSRSVWIAVVWAASMFTISLAAYPENSPGLPLGVIAWAFGVWGLGTSIASQRALVRALAERAEQLEHDREREIQQRLSAQRMQIARDLHDELAHNVAVISVNAGAAEAALPPGAEVARASLRTVRSTARNVLSELQEILGLLRDENTRDTVLPRVDDIVNAAAELGLRADVTGPWLPADEPTTSHVTAARILQESLTNARRHGSGGRATVALQTSARQWTMTVTNAVAALPRPASRTGFGVIGMTERADLVGGHFSSHAVDGSWVATLTLPLRAEDLIGRMN